MADLRTIPPPLGLVTLLFTRLEEAPALLRQPGPAPKALLSWHDSQLRAAFARAGGYEVKREGSSFIYAFASVAAALHAAISAQDALAAMAGDRAPDEVPTVQVGIGLHAGPVHARLDPRSARMDYLGPSVNLAARLGAAARGGQILMTRETLDSAREEGFPVDSPERAGAWIAQRGEHALKGFVAPVALVEMRPARLARQTLLPPVTLRTLNTDAIPHNLPDLFEPFFGREEELGEADDALHAGWRALVVLGAVGIGKTRFALELARRRLLGLDEHLFPGGIWLVGLAGVRDLQGLAVAISRTLNIRLVEADTLGQLGAALGQIGRAMVILDELDLVGRQASLALGRLLALAPELVLVATTRNAHQVPGAHVISLGPLPVPPVDASPQMAASSPSVRLFLHRLRQRVGWMDSPPGVVSKAAAVARRLEGMPLALELAASASQGQAPAEVVDALEKWAKRRVLSLGPSDESAARLVAAFERSWTLLPPWARLAFCQLAVFRGGFSVESAEAVLDLYLWPDAPPALDTLQLLLDHSLIGQQPGGAEGPRLYILGALAAIGLTRLQQPGAVVGPGGQSVTGPEAHAAAERRHGDWFARRARAVRHGVGLVRELGDDLQNLAAVVRRAARRGELAQALPTALVLLALLDLVGPYDQVDRVVEPLVTLPGLSDGDAATLHATAARILLSVGQVAAAMPHVSEGLRHAPPDRLPGPRALVLLEASRLLDARGSQDRASAALDLAVSLARESGEARPLCYALLGRASWALSGGDVTAAGRLLAEAQIHSRLCSDPDLEGLVLQTTATLHLQRGHPEQAILVGRSAVERLETAGYRRHAAVARTLVASAAEELGRLDEAEALLREAVAALAAVGASLDLARGLDLLSYVRRMRGRLLEARADQERALSIYARLEHRASEAVALGNLGVLLGELGQHAEARHRLSEAVSQLRELRVPGAAARFLACQARAEAALGQPGAAIAHFDEALRILRSIDEPRALACALALRGLFYLERQEYGVARACLADIDELRTGSRVGPNAELRKTRDELRAKLAAIAGASR